MGAKVGRERNHLHALGPSVQVKTCAKPHERTSASTSLWDFIWLLAERAVVRWGDRDDEIEACS